jgi:hypothetical protein
MTNRCNATRSRSSLKENAALARSNRFRERDFHAADDCPTVGSRVTSGSLASPGRRNGRWHIGLATSDPKTLRKASFYALKHRLKRTNRTCSVRIGSREPAPRKGGRGSLLRGSQVASDSARRWQSPLVLLTATLPRGQGDQREPGKRREEVRTRGPFSMQPSIGAT